MMNPIARSTMRRVLAILACATFTAPALAQSDFSPATPESQGLDPEALAKLREVINGYVADDMIVGGELLVIKNRHTVAHLYFGLTDRDPETKWGNGTICNIRSMSKPITGAAAQILIDRGELSLDDPVSKYVPGFDNDKSRDITVRQLITHRSGLPLTIITQSIDQYDDLSEQANAAGERGPQFEPESKFWYSDAGSDVLGRVVEVVSGQRLDEFVTKEIFEPLGMTDSFYGIDASDDRFSRIASLFFGTPKNWNRFWTAADNDALYPFAWGSQTIYGTPMDYAKFLAMWMDGGRVGEKRVLSEEAVSRTLTPVSPMAMLGSDARFPTAFADQEVWYGQMSVLHIEEGGGPSSEPIAIGHSGSDGTIAWAWPARDLLVLFYTQSRGGGAVLRLEEQVERLLLNPAAYASGTNEAPAELQPYLGTYVADFATLMKEEIEVRYDHGKLIVDIPSQMAFELKEAAEEGKWNFVAVPAITVWFEQERDGAFDLLRLDQGGLVFGAARKGTELAATMAEEAKLDRADVEQYLGTYELADSDVTLEFVFADDGLAFRSSEIPELTLNLWPVPGEPVWLVRQNGMAVMRFNEDESGRVVSVNRILGQDVATFTREPDDDRQAAAK